MTISGQASPNEPLRFAPLFEYRPWGGRGLADLFGAPLPGDGPVGEAWILSDRDDHASRVARGPFEGRTLRQLLDAAPRDMLGARADDRRRFPLLLKFLDAEKMLSVQVHPGDAHTSLLPSGETGKTEAWVVLRASAESRIYAGLLPGTTLESLRRGLARGRPQDHLASFTPKVGDCVFIPAGTVHALGGDLVVFEAQENSDVTFRLFDWGHVDGRTGLPRPLQVENALACVDFARGPVGRTMPRIDATTPGRERLVECDQFSMWRVRAKAPTTVGAAGTARALVSIEGGGTLEHDGKSHPMKQGDVFVLPAAVGACEFRPTGLAVLLEVGLPVPSSPDRSTDGARR